MSYFDSSVDKPLQFYEHLLSENGYKEYRELFFLKYENELEDDAMAYEINKDGDYVRDFYLSSILNSEQIYTLKESIIKRCNIELEKSKNFISEKISFLQFYNEPVEPFLIELSDKIYKLLSEKKDVIKKIPELFTHLSSLTKYINSLSMQTISNENIGDETVMYSHEPEIDKDEELVHEIFGYLKMTNDLGIEYMSESEYLRMTGLILKMIKNREVPEIGNEINFKAKVNVDVLRYTFYVLQLSFFDKDKHDYFYEFMFNTFKQFQGIEDIKNLKTKISIIPHKLPEKISPKIEEQISIQKKRRI